MNYLCCFEKKNEFAFVSLTFARNKWRTICWKWYWERNRRNRRNQWNRNKLWNLPGFRENSYVVWVPEEQQLYYRKRVLKNGTQSCTCTVDGCNAKIFIKIDGTAYEEYRMTSCFNKMKHKAKTAPVCMDPFDIYTEVIKEWVFDFTIPFYHSKMMD